MKKLLPVLFSILFITNTFAQNVTILPSGITPAIAATYPRLSYEAILALPTPQTGDLAYDVTFKCLRQYSGTTWLCTFQDPASPKPNLAAFATVGGTSEDYPSDIISDNAGNVYVTGSYSGTATFGSITITSAGGTDIFLAKYNKQGALLWIKSAGGTNNDSPTDMALLGGNIIITGSFSATASFGTISKTSAGNLDIFLASYSPSGALDWVQTAGGTSFDISNGVCVDNLDNIHIAGSFIGTSTFGSVPKTSAGNQDVFIASYSPAGVFQNVTSAGGVLDDICNEIAVDEYRKVYIIGSFSGTTTFGAYSKTSAGDTDMFLAQYNTTEEDWELLTSAGGISADNGQGVVVDYLNNVYIVGDFTGTATFDFVTKTSMGSSDIFIAKYNDLGNLQWIDFAGGTSSDYGSSIATDTFSNIFITGYYSKVATFGANSIGSEGDFDAFIANYSTAGKAKWVHSIGANNTEIGTGISSDILGNVYAIGFYFGLSKFGTTNNISAGDSDIFVVKLDK